MKRLLPALFAAALLGAALAPAAGNPLAGRKRPANAGPTVVTSDKLEYDYKNNIARFDGHVNVKDPSSRSRPTA